MTSVDRIQGLSGSLAVKAPVRAATTAAITLSGEQTVDGVAVVEGDRVLVKDQASSVDNGIYDVSTGGWTRALDFDGANDFVQGTAIVVQQGTTYANTMWKVTTAAPSIGSALAFDQLLPGDASAVEFTPAGTGAVVRAVQDKLRDLPSVTDYSSLALAQAAAGIKSLLDPASGRMWMLGITAPVFDEAANVLGRGLAFDSLGATISIGAGKQYNFIGIRNGGSDINITLGASSALCSGMSFYLSSQSGSHSSSNLYGVIGDISNYGPGTTKAVYGRVVAKSGMTGAAVAGVFRTQLDTGSTPAGAYCLQVGHAGDIAKVLNGVIWIDSEAASGKAAYGILSDIKMGYTTAFIRGVAGGGGKAFQWQASGGGADLMNVLESGRITLAPASANSLMLDLQSGARINFTGTAATASIGGAGAPPAQVAQYVLVQVSGTDYKIPVYNV